MRCMLFETNMFSIRIEWLLYIAAIKRLSWYTVDSILTTLYPKHLPISNRNLGPLDIYVAPKLSLY